MEDQHKTNRQLIAEIEALRRQVKRLETVKVRSRHIEHELKMSEARYRRLFETAQDGILILDGRTGQINEANRRILKMLEYSAEQLIGKKLWQISAFIDIRKCRAAYQELRKQCLE